MQRVQLGSFLARHPNIMIYMTLSIALKEHFQRNAHRALTHNAWFGKFVLERVKFSNSCEPIGNSFPYIILKNGKKVSVRDVFEQHVLEDFSNRFIPSAQDYLEHVKYQDWMGNGKGTPSSFQNTQQESTRGTLNPVINDGTLSHKKTMTTKFYD